MNFLIPPGRLLRPRSYLRLLKSRLAWPGFPAAPVPARIASDRHPVASQRPAPHQPTDGHRELGR